MSDPIVQGAKYDIVVFQGGSYKKTFTCFEADGVTPRALTGFTTGAAEIRSETGGELLATMTVVVVEGGGSTPGSVTLTMDAATTAGIGRSGKYDVLLIHTNGVDRDYFVQGRVTLDRRVTVVP